MMEEEGNGLKVGAIFVDSLSLANQMSLQS